MIGNKWKWFFSLVLFFELIKGVSAMELNLNLPWSTKMSPPAVLELQFYSPQSDDMLFGAVKEVEIRCRAGVHPVGLKYAVSRNCMSTPFIQGDAEALPANTYVIKVPTEKLYPGFYDVKVWLDTGEAKAIEGINVFGYQIEKMKVRETRPADFADFWNKGKAVLKTIPLDAQAGEMKTFKGKEIDAYNLAQACLPGDYDPKGHKTEEVEACKVSFASVNGLRVYGWLAKPKGEGPFPAMLVLPGGGIAPRPMPLEHARHGYVSLDIQIHGHDVDIKEYPKVPGYYDNFTFEPVEKFYYHTVYLNALQAINYLVSRPDVDKQKIVLVGGSQGGRLSVVLAALDERVAAVAPAIAHNGNVVYTQWAEACGKAGKDGMDMEIPPVPADTPEQKCLPYYDVMNFAPNVKCPALMNIGLIDPVSLPTGVWAIYQRLGSRDKRIILLPGMAHDWSAEFDRQAWRWLDEKLPK
jgi:cephalosporin-C deacetylase-like acetyl esterase